MNRRSEHITLVEHVIKQERDHPSATGDFSWLLCGLTLASKIIDSHIKRAGIVDVLGATDDTNVHGEVVQKLDVLANQSILKCLAYRGNVGILVSEEDEEPTVIKEGPEGKYIVLFDPLDGSSNIDIDAPVGTIFSVLERPEGGDASTQPLQQGTRQIAAGYIIYGNSTVLCYTTGDGVHMFTLDPSIGAFVLSNEHVRMGGEKIYSVNEAYYDSFPEGYRRYINWVKNDGNYTQRYIGSLVGDFHRTILKGGVFLYPPTGKQPNGKLRLMYEANPIAFLAEQAGGTALDGYGRIMDKHPSSLHERTPLVIGDKDEVERVRNFIAQSSG